MTTQTETNYQLQTFIHQLQQHQLRDRILNHYLTVANDIKAELDEARTHEHPSWYVKTLGQYEYMLDVIDETAFDLDLPFVTAKQAESIAYQVKLIKQNINILISFGIFAYYDNQWDNLTKLVDNLPSEINHNGYYVHKSIPAMHLVHYVNEWEDIILDILTDK